MSEGLNLVTLLGNLGADPELSQTAGGPLLKMRLATSYSYLDKEKKRQEKTEWHTVKLWGRRGGGLVKILSKGSRIVVQGRLATSSWEKDGQKHSKTEVIATEVYLAGGPTPNGMVTRKPDAEVLGAQLPF